MAQSKKQLIDKSFFDSENFEFEKKRRKDLVKPLNDFLEACKPFGFTFQDTRELEQFCESIDRHGTAPIFDRLVNMLSEKQPEIAGFKMTRQALLDSVELPDPEPLVSKLGDVRVAAKDNFNPIRDLSFDADGKVYVPDAILQTLEDQYTLKAETEDQAVLMSMLEQTADCINSLQSLYYELNLESRAQTRRPLLEYVKNGHIDPSAFRIIKALK
jgi:hypothetical protein